MVRSGRSLFPVLLLILPVIFFAAPAYGQDSPSSEEPVALEQPDADESESPTGDVGATLPENFPTRETYERPTEETPQVGPTLTDYFRIFGGLAVVLFVIWGLSVVVKRFIQVRGLATSTECLKVLYTMSLTPTRILYLVRLGDRILLIGAGDGGMRTLAEITEPEEVSIILRDLEFKGNFDLNPFRTRLTSLLEAGESPGGHDDDLNVRQRKLKGILEKLKTPPDDD